jgi:tetratricopeptide (TPR) repeat protein
LVAAAIARGDFKTAAQQGAQLVKIAPDSFEAWFNLGIAYQKTNRLEQAGQAYSEAIKIRPDSGLPYANLGATLQERGDVPAARKAYERALQLAPGHTGALWNLANVFERLGNNEEAEKAMEKLLENEPEREDAWFRLGYYRLLRGDYAGSIEPFRTCVSKRSDWLDALINLGLAQWRTGQLEAAKATLVQAVARHPKSTDALRTLAAVIIDMGDYILALDIDKQLGELGQTMPELSYNIGILLQRSNLHEEAARSYRRATDEKPAFAEALLNLGHALKALGQDQEARTCWRKAVEAKPELATQYF